MEFFPSTCHLSQSGSRDDLTGLWNVQYFADVWWDARALIRIPCNSKAAPCILASPSPRVEQLPAILFISRSRIPFLPSRYVTAVGTIRSRFPGRPVSRLDAIRSGPRWWRKGRFFCASFAQNLGEHSFAEEAKVEANYREASREGGLMRSPMTGHICSPSPAPFLLPRRWRFHVGVKEHRPLRKFYHRYARLRPSPLPSSPSFLSISLLSDSPGSFLLSIGTSSFFSHGPVQYGTSWDPKRSERWPSAVVTVIPQKDSDARLPCSRLSSLASESALLFLSLSCSLLSRPPHDDANRQSMSENFR